MFFLNTPGYLKALRNFAKNGSLYDAEVKKITKDLDAYLKNQDSSNLQKAQKDLEKLIKNMN